jgi:hypothetical protein
MYPRTLPMNLEQLVSGLHVSGLTFSGLATIVHVEHIGPGLCKLADRGEDGAEIVFTKFQTVRAKIAEMRSRSHDARKDRRGTARGRRAQRRRWFQMEEFTGWICKDLRTDAS